MNPCFDSSLNGTKRGCVKPIIYLSSQKYSSWYGPYRRRRGIFFHLKLSTKTQKCLIIDALCKLDDTLLFILKCMPFSIPRHVVFKRVYLHRQQCESERLINVYTLSDFAMTYLDTPPQPQCIYSAAMVCVQAFC